MKIYIDTNVYLDYLLERKNSYGKDLSRPAFGIFKRAVACEFHVVLSYHLLNELHANIKESDTHMLLKFLRKKLILIEDEKGYKGDEKHAVLAKKAGADLIVTINIKHLHRFISHSEGFKVNFPQHMATILARIYMGTPAAFDIFRRV